jgi:hypothetical protein
MASSHATPEPAALVSCKNCGHLFEGHFCSQCGQEVRLEGDTVKEMIKHRWHHWLHSLEIFLHTTWHLILRPGTVVNEFISGRRQTWYNAANYFVLIGSIAALVVIFLRPFDSFTAESYGEMYRQMGVEMSEAGMKGGAASMVWLNKHYNLLLLLTIPFLAIGSWLANRKAGRHLGHHLTFILYLYGLNTLVTLPTLPFMNMSDISGSMLFTIPLMGLIFSWGYRDWLGYGWIKAIWRTVLMYVLYFVLMMAGIFLLTILAVLILVGIMIVMKKLGMDPPTFLQP